MFAVTRAARHRDGSLVASAGWQLIPRDGTASGSRAALGSVQLPPSPAGMQPRWDFSPAVFPGHCPVVEEALREKARGERVGFVLNVRCSGIR